MKHAIKQPTRPSLHHQQQGVVSIFVIVFIITTVVFVLGATVLMSSKKAVDSEEYLNSVTALYLAESGAEHAFARISRSSTACSDYAAGGQYTLNTPVKLGRGTYQYLAPTASTNPNNCPVRIKGSVTQTQANGTDIELSQRLIQIEISPGIKLGTANFGGTGTDPYKAISMRLYNEAPVRGVAVFNLAWRRQGSTGHEKEAPGGQATAASCTNCPQLWSLESSSGTPSVGSLGTAVPIGANQTVDVLQTLSLARNYAEVGMVMPGMGGATQPELKGSFYGSKFTTNNDSQKVTTGKVTSGQTSDSSTNNWCKESDTLVFGVSGKAANDFTAQITSIVFNSSGSPSQPILLSPNPNRVAHFPDIDGSDYPNAQGDIFSEIWYTYNPYYYAAAVTSTGTTVTVPSTTGLKDGTILKVYSGTGAFVGNTRVVKGTITPTTFQVSVAPTVPLNNATICGGICALFDNPASTTSTTIFSVTRTDVTDSQWAGGFVCLSGVNPDLIKPVTASSARLTRWHEVLSDEQ